MHDLSELRKQIDEIDRRLMELLEQRFSVVEKVADYKKANNMAILNSGREKEVVSKNLSLLKDGKFAPYAEPVLKKIMESSRELQSARNDIVGFQGVPGSYSYEAALKFTLHTKAQLKAFDTLGDLCTALKNGDISYAVMPFENSSTGAVVDVYDILVENDFFVVREVNIRINHNLLANKDAEISDIKEIYSHQQAFMQCKEYLRGKKVKQVEYSNTAASARFVSESGRNDIAAIASAMAAEIYSLKILDSGINFNSENVTKFIVLSRSEACDSESDTISVIVEINDLHKLMGIFGENNISVIKMEPRPKINSTFKYQYFIDFAGHINDYKVKTAISSLKTLANSYKFLGCYRTDKKGV